MHLVLRILICCIFPVIWLGLGSGWAAAQEPVKFQAADTSSPRDTLRSFIEACNEINTLIHEERILNRHSSKHARLAARVIDCIDISERLNFAIFREFEKHGIQFSLPFRHSFWKHDGKQGPLDVQLLQNDESKPD